MSDPEIRFHQEWLGLIQPSEGLVVSIPVLGDAQCMARQAPAVQQKLLDLCPVVDAETEQRAIRPPNPIACCVTSGPLPDSMPRRFGVGLPAEIWTEAQVETRAIP